MITSSLWRGKRYAVLGLARSGQATVRALVASGAAVTAWDDSDTPQHALIDQLKSDGLPEHGEDFYPGFSQKRAKWAQIADLSKFDAIIVSPGVPLNRHWIADRAAKYGVPIIGDIELFAQARSELPPHKVVGITGTNGKSTTTALVHHILQTAGVPTTMGGNIGLPILAQDPLPEGGVYVLELSSYQIDLTYSLDCDVAVLLNITPDHLDRYDGFEGYAAAKARLFAMQTAGHNSVTGVSEARDYSVLEATPGGVVASFIEDAFDFKDKWSIKSPMNWPALQGPHNLQNGKAAIEVCDILGLGHDIIEDALRTYPGLPHRMERIAEANGILFINDSKATNAASAAPALAAYPPAADGRHRVHWIAGGLAKEDGLGECAAHLGNVARAYLIGDAAPMLARHLAGQVPVEQSGTVDAAIRDAVSHAQSGDVILLSPAAASFDQFRDFEARGAQFRTIVTSIIASGEAQA